MRALPILIFSAAVSAGCSVQPFGSCGEEWPAHSPIDSPFLHQDGANIADGDGEPVMLRGVNLGGWLHWEAWMFGGGLDISDLNQGSEGDVLARVDELYGADTAAHFQQRIREAFVTEADFEAIAAMGFDVVRLPINHSLLDDEAGWGHLDQALAWAEAQGLTVVIDMHAAPGGQSDMFMADPDDLLLWDDSVHQDHLVEDWAAIAARYVESEAIAGYDLLNEPAEPDAATLIALYERVIAAIRAEDEQHMLVIEGAGLSRDFNVFSERLDDNMVYSPHVYLWVGWPDQRWISALQELSACHDTPVWVGEFGEDRYADVQGLREGFETMAGWAVWSWKKVDEGGTPGITTIDAPDEWIELMVSLNEEPGTTGTIGEDAALEALEAFLEAAASPTVDEEMKAALGL